MRIAKRLEIIREEFPECETVVYVDISTSMVLASNAKTQLRQEYLDHLCKTAVEMLISASSPHLTAFWGQATANDDSVYQAIIIDPDQVAIFLKSTTNTTDALCCVCTRSPDTTAFISGARHHLEAIGQDG